MMTPPTITTERLLIEPIAMKHWEPYAAAWADPQMTQYISPEPRARQESWIKFMQGAGMWSVLGYGYLAFCDRETGSYLGLGGLGQFERGIAGLVGYPEAGWAFVPDAWNKGYATEAMVALLDWADEALAEPEIRCIIDMENVPSRRVGEKLGFALLEVSDGSTGPLGLFSRKRRG